MFTTPEKINALVDNVQYHHFPNTTMTVACVQLKNGFCVVGKSACAIPADFNEELGRQYALEEAMKKVWDLEAYSYKDRVHNLT